MADTAMSQKTRDNIFASIDELRAKLDALVNEAFGQQPAKKGQPPEQAAAQNVGNLIKNAPPGLLMEELKRLSQNPSVQKAVTPNDSAGVSVQH